MSLPDDSTSKASSAAEAANSLEKASSSSPREDDYRAPPDGGLRAWLVAAGAASAFLTTSGYNSSFGVFQAYYAFHQLSDRSADDIAWIGSIQGFFMLGSGVVAGPLFDRYGTKVVRPASLIYVFSVMMTSLCREYWQFMLAQGVLSGLGAGFVACSVIGPVGQWFDKRRGAAMGLAISGSSIGAVVFPLLISNLLTATDVGFAWTVRISGFLMLPFLTFTALTVKPLLPPHKTAFFLWRLFKDPMYCLLVAGLFFSLIGYLVPMFLLPTYAITRGMNDTLAGYLLAILNAASFFGRVIPGILGDKLGRINVFAGAGLSSSIVIYCWPLAETNSAIIGMAVLFGLFGGSILSGASASLLECADSPKNLGTYVGLALSVGSLSTFIGPPVSGALLDKYGGFDQISWFCGTMTLAGVLCTVAAKTMSSVGLFGRI